MVETETTMSRMTKYLLGVVFGALSMTVHQAKAADVDTLPQSVRMVQARYGVNTGLNQTWKSDGKLYELGDTQSISFNATTLARVSQRAQALIAALDFFGRNDLGSKINLGTLEVSTKPQLEYFVPVMAYGLSSRWTLGVGLPVMRYSNQIRLSSGPSNLEFYRSQLEGRVNRELDEALNMNIVDESRKVLAQKGFKPIQDRDETFLGDVEVALLHRLARLGSWDFMHQMSVTLPTGPKDDPDDLMALNKFHRLAFNTSITASRRLFRNWKIVPYGGLQLPVPDQVVKRVPRDEGDTIPDADSKQEVTRIVGATATAGSELRWAFARSWSVMTGAESFWKSQDRYTGSGRMDLLEKDTEQSGTIVRAGFGYSTVASYMQNLAAAPMQMGLTVSDMIMGRNKERQMITEFSAALFF